MATTLDKLQKYGLEASFEYDNDEDLSLQASRGTFLAPLWRPKWAYNLIRAEEVFENIKEEDYTESLWCLLCCDENCAKCTCCAREKKGGIKTGNVTPRRTKFKNKKNEGEDLRLFQERSKTRCEKLFDRIFSMNPFFNAHYFFHLAFNLPIFYAALTLVQVSAVTFRIARYLWLCFYALIDRCNCCDFGWSSLLSLMIGSVINTLYLALAGALGSIIYWSEVMINSLFFRPFVCAGIFYNVFLRNTQAVEPLVLNSSFTKWVESVWEEWAEAADMLVKDPDGLEANTVFRNPIMSPKLLLTSFSVLPSIVNQKIGAEVAGPFLIQLILLWIVYTSLYVDASGDDPTDSGLVRRMAAAAAFLYYLSKASTSAGHFVLLCKGHTSNLFLLVDFVGNIVFPYIIIPMAVQIVLNSDGLDIVLNLIALDFATTIDEELFDEAAKYRCQAPYCFVFRIRELPRRRFGITEIADEKEHVLLVDVYNKTNVKERLAENGKAIETTYWALNSDLSQFQAKLKPGARLRAMQEALEASKWNQNAANDEDADRKSGPSRQTKIETKIANSKMHLCIFDIPSGVSEKAVQKAVEETKSFKPLGECIGISFLDKPLSWREIGATCRFKEIRGKASLWFQHPEAIPSCFATFVTDGKERVVAEREKRGKEKMTAILKVSPLIPTLDDDSNDGKLTEMTKNFEISLLQNYKPSAHSDVLKTHLRTLGKYKIGGEDSRIVLFYDFPFPLEGSYPDGGKGWLRFTKPSEITTGVTSPPTGKDQNVDEKKKP